MKLCSAPSRFLEVVQQREVVVEQRLDLGGGRTLLQGLHAEDDRAGIVVEAVALLAVREMVAGVLQQARIVGHAADVLQVDLRELLYAAQEGLRVWR